MKRGGKGLPEDSKEAKKLEGIIANSSLTSDQLNGVLQKIKKPSENDLSTNLHKFSKKSVTILQIGDLHLNAKEVTTKKRLCDFKKLNEVLKIGKEEGAEYIIQTGDVTDGENMRPWQKYNLVVQGWDDVVDYCANEWPNIGLPTYFIGGNHDQTYLNSIGGDICKAIAGKRSDLIYLGMNEGNLPLQPQYIKMMLEGKKVPNNATWVRILHPGKGTTKSQSYQIQSHIAALQPEFKPRILVIGHYHKMDYLFTRNVHAFQAGTMEHQSDWMRRKDLTAQLGAWLTTFYFKEDGTIDGIKKRLLSYEVNGNEKWGNFMDERGVYEAGK